MAEQQLSINQHLLFHEETMEDAYKYFQLTAPILTKNKLPPNPLNFSLIYNYIAGRDAQLKEQLDKILSGNKEWTQEEAKTLFLRFIYSCDESSIEGVHDELLKILTEMSGSLLDIAGKTAVSNEKLENQIEKLAGSKNAQEVLSIASVIMSETKSIAIASKELEVQLTSSSTEIVKLKKELEQARKETFIDALTGISNRRGFDLKLATLIEGSKNKVPDFSMIMVDIDHFKKINDQYGHLVGDNVIRVMAQLLKKHTKGGDDAARYGGEEFAVLLPETRINNALTVAENIRAHLEKLVIKRPGSGKKLDVITASFGVGGYRSGETTEEFINRCDQALYKAKKRGRNRVVLAD